MASPPANAWVGGLCDCGGCSQAMGACCCFPCYYGRTTHRMKHFPRDPKETGFSWFNGDCAIMWIANVFAVPWIPQMMTRSEHRERVGIEGGKLGDCCITFWCPCCAATQQDLDVKTRAEAARLVDANGAPAQGYEKQQQNGMAYQQPMQ